MNFLRKIWDNITTPFISVAVMFDESRRINEDGRWDSYWERKNRKNGSRKKF